jgi:hypothetical protein
MKDKIRKILLGTEISIFTSPENFAKWLIKLRQEENILNKKYSESPEEYENSKEFINQLFWQIVCLRFIQLLNQPSTDKNFDSIENIIKNYDELDDLKTLVPFVIEIKDLMYCAWDVSKEVDVMVNESNNFINEGKDTDDFFYLLRHFTGHGVRPELKRFASNLSRDLKE